MKMRPLLILISLTLIGVTLLLLDHHQDDNQHSHHHPQALAGHLQKQLDNIRAVRLSSGGKDEKKTTLQRTGDGWQIAEKNNYPADSRKVRGFILALSDSRQVEAKTRNPEYYSRLNVQDIEQGGNTLVEMMGVEPGLTLIIGRTSDNGIEGTYIRHQQDPQTWLVDKKLTPSADAGDWLAEDILSLDKNRIKEITITHANGDRMVLDKVGPEQPHFNLKDKPEDRELQSPQALDGIADTLVNLKLKDVMPRADVKPAHPVTTTIDTFDGLQLTATLFQQDDRDYLMLQATTMSGLSGTDNPNVEKVTEEAADLNRRLSPWVFQISPYHYAGLTKSMASVLKPLPEKQVTADDGEEVDELIPSS